MVVVARRAFAVSAAVSTLNIGYVCGDAELITLAHLVADDAAEAGAHPVVLAARWVAAGEAGCTMRWRRCDQPRMMGMMQT